MAAYSLVRLDPDSSALGTVRSKTSSLRVNLEHSLKEAVYNLLSWVRDNDDRGVNGFMEEIDHRLGCPPTPLGPSQERGAQRGLRGRSERRQGGRSLRNEVSRTVFPWSRDTERPRAFRMTVPTWLDQSHRVIGLSSGGDCNVRTIRSVR